MYTVHRQFANAFRYIGNIPYTYEISRNIILYLITLANPLYIYWGKYSSISISV